MFYCRTNFLRLCVFQVTQQSGQHLEKIGNVEDIVKCIHSVIHSNDPVARALTLKCAFLSSYFYNMDLIFYCPNFNYNDLFYLN